MESQELHLPVDVGDSPVQPKTPIGYRFSGGQNQYCIIFWLGDKVSSLVPSSQQAKVVRLLNYLLPPGPNDAPGVTPPLKVPDTAAPNALAEAVGVVDPKVSPDDGIDDDPVTPGVVAFAWPLGPTTTLPVPARPMLNGFPGLVTMVCPLPNNPMD